MHPVGGKCSYKRCAVPQVDQKPASLANHKLNQLADATLDQMFGYYSREEQVFLVAEQDDRKAA